MTARILVEGLKAARGDAELLSAVTFSAQASEFIGLVGPNGAGKSTLLRAIAGLERPAAGAVRIRDADIGAMNARDRARALAYLPQLREAHWSVSAEAVVALGRFAYGAPGRLSGPDREAVERAMKAADVARYRGRDVTTLSGGEQARVHLARALAGETDILLADEPAAALDPKHQLAVMEILRGRADDGALVIAALHDLALAARFCKRIIVLDEGAIAADGPPGDALSPATLANVFGVTRRNGNPFEFSRVPAPQ